MWVVPFRCTLLTLTQQNSWSAWSATPPYHSDLCRPDHLNHLFSITATMIGRLTLNLRMYDPAANELTFQAMSLRFQHTCQHTSVTTLTLTNDINKGQHAQQWTTFWAHDNGCVAVERGLSRYYWNDSGLDRNCRISRKGAALSSLDAGFRMASTINRQCILRILTSSEVISLLENWVICFL